MDPRRESMVGLDDDREERAQQELGCGCLWAIALGLAAWLAAFVLASS